MFGGFFTFSFLGCFCCKTTTFFSFCWATALGSGVGGARTWEGRESKEAEGSGASADIKIR